MPVNGTANALALSTFSDTTPVVIDAADQPLALTVDDVLKYIAPTAPRHEALLFLLTCKAMRINPLIKEAFLTPNKDKWVTVVAKAGYIRAAQRHEAYNGHEAGIVAQPYDKSKVRQGQPPPYTGPPVDFDGCLLPDGYLLVGGWAKVWRKGVDRPVTSRVSMNEYDRRQSTWLTIPCTMIRKVALVAAIREAFAMGGYDEVEMPVMQANQVNEPASAAPTPGVWASRVVGREACPLPPPPFDPTPPAERISPVTAARLVGLMDRAGMSSYQRNVALTRRGVDRVEDLDEVAASQMVNKLEATLSVAEWDPLGDKGKDAGKVGDESEGPSVTVAETAMKSIVPQAAPRRREPGDDDEPFDAATGKVIDADFDEIAGDARSPAEIAEEFDRPLGVLTKEQARAEVRAAKKEKTKAEAAGA